MHRHLLNGPQNKKIIVRIDMNGGEQEGYKIWRYAKEMTHYKKMADNGCSVVLLTHYGRKGDKDFRENLEFLVESLKEVSGIDMKYVHGLTEDEVLDAVSEPGVYMLKNIRIHDSEKQGGFNELAEFFVNNFDIFLNDAPAVLHRGHTSVTLPDHMPSHVGNVMLEEIGRLDKVKNSSTRILVWGGAKLDKIKYIETLAKEGWTVLLGGIPAVEFEAAKSGTVNKMTPLLDCSGMVAPIDFVMKNGKAVDIGPKTVDMYEKIIEGKGGIFSGPMGKYEDGYEESSTRLMKHCTAILGGHSGNIAHKYQMDGIMTSGGSALAYLSDKELPGMDAIKGNKR